ncbi:hypothetical protein [Streptomyces goshikiensis]|uniref:hypothetical protein n=1 Tax=Streptomyces goshikiensis TaxID=1942 RepID=UPI003655A038
MLDSQAKAAAEGLRYKMDQRYLVLEISGNSAVVNQQGPAGSGHSDFIAALPEDACRYALYTDTSGKAVLITWTPEGASVKQKMLYDSQKNAVHGELGYDTFPHIEASEYNDISEDVIAARGR